MGEIVTLNELHSDSIKRICDRCFTPNFHITKEKIQRNLFEAEDFYPKASFVAMDEKGEEVIGFIGVKVRKTDEVYADTAWISLLAVDPYHSDKDIGGELLDKALDVLSAEGIKTVYVGMDYKNFFSGIPAPTKRSIDFFEKHGFKADDTDHYDVEASVLNNAKLENFDVDPFEGRYKVSTFGGEEKELIEFLDREFPGRWPYEAKEAFRTKKPYEMIMLLWDENEVIGFCMLNEYDVKYGGLGPIGIAESARGKHLGDYILRQSLMQLKKLGMGYVNIDWTRLLEFYGQFDFKVERIYRGCLKQLL
ncbi:MAG: GNAT family N-acetyltransferase [Lachnospiraceae bacterium]|nr:GNAT family N-acetyltransferase [Lachnospiraceae bacterium]